MSLFGLIILGILFLFNITQQDINLNGSNTSTFIGKSIKFTEVRNLNEKPIFSKISLNDSIFVLVSPTCPHCINFLKILNHLNKDDTLRSIIHPIFKNKSNTLALLNFIQVEKFNFPLYQIGKNELIDSVKTVPTFFFVEDGKVKNMIAGGINSEIELKKLINTLVNGQWKKSESSLQLSACSH